MRKFIDIIILFLIPFLIIFSFIAVFYADGKDKIAVLISFSIVVLLLLKCSISQLTSVNDDLKFVNVFMKYYKKLVTTDTDKVEEYVWSGKTYKVFMDKISLGFLIILILFTVGLISYESYYGSIICFRVSHYELPFERILLGLWLFWVVVFGQINQEYKSIIFTKKVKLNE